MANKAELVMLALDVTAFFLVTTDLYGRERLEALTDLHCRASSRTFGLSASDQQLWVC
jgi:hypothetical protein